MDDDTLDLLSAEILEAVDEALADMTLAEAVDWLEVLLVDLGARLTAFRYDLQRRSE